MAPPRRNDWGFRKRGIMTRFAQHCCMVFAILVGLGGCASLPKRVVTDAGTITFSTITDGLTAFKAWYPTEIASIKQQAISNCKDKKLAAEYTACTDAIVNPRVAPLEAVVTALKVYDGLLTAGVAASDGQMVVALANLLKVLDAVKIHINLPTAPPVPKPTTSVPRSTAFLTLLAQEALS